MRRVTRSTPTDGDERLTTGQADPHIEAAIRRWAVISARVQELEGQKGALRPELLTWAERRGRVDAGGHQHVDLSTPIQMPGGKTLLGVTREKRVSRVLNEESVRELAAEKGLTDRFFREEVITVLDTEEIYRAHQEELISDEELEGLIDTTITYALKGR